MWHTARRHCWKLLRTLIAGIFFLLFCFMDPNLSHFSISAVPPFSGLCWFPDGPDYKQWTGDDSKVLMKVGNNYLIRSSTLTISPSVMFQSLLPLGLWLPRGCDILTTDCGTCCVMSPHLLMSCDTVLWRADNWLTDTDCTIACDTVILTQICSSRFHMTPLMTSVALIS